jgi:signal transduction histidine kinase
VDPTPKPTNRSSDLRILVVAPSGRDAELLCDLLSRAGFDPEACPSCEAACIELERGAGLVIVAEESLTRESVQRLVKMQSQQPSWSDFPLIVLTVAGEVSYSSQRRGRMRQPLGNVLLLERPVRPETLVSTVNGALKARLRQYEVRDYLEQRKKAEEALRKSEKLAVAGRLAASIAHEINNPLASVTNLLYLIGNATTLEEVRRYLPTAEQELARVSLIATQTLKFYREPSGPARVSVSELLDSVLGFYKDKFRSGELKLVTQYRDATPIEAYSGELKQVFANLITNAVDSMHQGGTLWVKANGATSNGGGVRVTIADTGSGIPREIREKIFEPFVTTKGNTGTGLGLWVSDEIVRKHGGSIRFRSRVGKQASGTVFSIHLPVRLPPQSAEVSPAEDPRIVTAR